MVGGRKNELKFYLFILLGRDIDIDKYDKFLLVLKKKDEYK